MPPKQFKPSKKAAGLAKKAPVASNNVTQPASLETSNESVQDASNAENTLASKKRRAESVGGDDENASKKPRQDGHVEKEINQSKEADGPGELDASIKKKLEDIRFILSDHTVRSLGVLMDDIGYMGERSEDIEEMIDIIILQFESKALKGEDLGKDMAAFEKVDQNHWDGEYDSDPDGLDRNVRRRLNKAEDMVGRLTKQYLKEIIKQLHFYGRGGTNADLAAEIVAMLTNMATEGENIKREYRIVKGIYGMCYGCCGNDSVDSAGISDAEGEDDNGLDDW